MTAEAADRSVEKSAPATRGDDRRRGIEPYAQGAVEAISLACAVSAMPSKRLLAVRMDNNFRIGTPDAEGAPRALAPSQATTILHPQWGRVQNWYP